MAKCIVFGGTGFIGSHLVEGLLSDGHEVTVFSRHQVANYNEKINFVYGDFLDVHSMKEAIKGQEYVFQFISLTNPALSEENPHIDLDTNVKMTIHLLEECVNSGIKKIIFASSGGAIYGQTNKIMLNEDDPTNPVSPYAIGKQSIEGYLRYFHNKHKLDYLTLRISNVYGTGQNASNGRHGIVPIFIEKILAQKPLTIYGDGSMTRDFIYIDDLISLIRNIFTKDTKYPLYNIGSGEGTSINDVIHCIETVTGLKSIRNYLEKPSSFVDSIVLDCSRAKEEFGEFATTTFIDGLEVVYRQLNSRND